MKIVDVAEFYAEQGGGVRTYIHQKLAAGAAAGHEIVIVAPGPEDKVEEKLGGRIVWVKGPPMPFDPRYFVLYRQKAVHQILDQERPDVVEGSSPWSGGWFAARWRGQAAKTFIFHQDPVAVYPQTFLDRFLPGPRIDKLFSPYWGYLRKLSGHYDATVVSGGWLAERLRRFGVQRPEPVPFGIDKGRFTPDNADDAVRRRWLTTCGVGPDASLVVGISRFHPEKRIGTIIEAFKRASKTRPMAFVLFGDGPTRKRVHKLAQGVKGLHLAGFVKDRELISATLASADAFLHGSAAETYGLVVAEAICSGLPIVVPAVGGAEDLAGPGYSELYTPGKAGECEAALLRCLGGDREAQRAAARTATETKIGTMADHFEGLFALYARLAAERGRRNG